MAFAEATPALLPPTVWQRLKKRKLALFGMALIALTIFGALFAPYLTPYEPNDQMCPSSYKMGHQSGLSIGGSGSFV
ncbi:hypothetical protein [Sulfitobacter sp. M220]|uniref:hypothetical protein n=1 Tax=Sulfitobacter sp. M220 TaxID=2675333 RepID=UPI0030192375